LYLYWIHRPAGSSPTLLVKAFDIHRSLLYEASAGPSRKTTRRARLRRADHFLPDARPGRRHADLHFGHRRLVTVPASRQAADRVVQCRTLREFSWRHGRAGSVALGGAGRCAMARCRLLKPAPSPRHRQLRLDRHSHRFVPAAVTGVAGARLPPSHEGHRAPILCGPLTRVTNARLASRSGCSARLGSVAG